MKVVDVLRLGTLDHDLSKCELCTVGNLIPISSVKYSYRCGRLYIRCRCDNCNKTKYVIPSQVIHT